MPVPAVPLSFKEPTLAMFSLPLIFSSTIVALCLICMELVFVSPSQPPISSRTSISRLSTGDSLDMSTQDESLIIAATLKDMEGAAVAYVAELLKVPVMFLKAVTDLIDGDKPTAEEFLQNLSLVTSALEETATKVINFINGKTLSDL